MIEDTSHNLETEGMDEENEEEEVALPRKKHLIRRLIAIIAVIAWIVYLPILIERDQFPELYYDSARNSLCAALNANDSISINYYRETYVKRGMVFWDGPTSRQIWVGVWGNDVTFPTAPPTTFYHRAWNWLQNLF